MELVILIVLITILLIAIKYFNMYNPKKESFTNENSEINDLNDYYLEACPAGLTGFYDKNGYMNCCAGEILGEKCLSDKKCVLYSKDINGTPSCIKMILEEYKQKGLQVCPSSMKNYFEGKDIKGCTSGNLNTTLNGPRNPSQRKCTIYKTEKENFTKVDSCQNQKLLDETECFGNECKKMLVDFSNKSLPPVVLLTFIDNLGMVRMAYNKKSLINYFNSTNKNWREWFNIDKNLYVDSVAKAYYIDRTLTKDQVEF